MDKWDWILLLGGIAVGGVFVYFFLRPVPTTVASQPSETYSNIEEWEIIKNPVTGRVEGVRVKRTAKTY